MWARPSASYSKIQDHIKESGEKPLGQPGTIKIPMDTHSGGGDE